MNLPLPPILENQPSLRPSWCSLHAYRRLMERLGRVPPRCDLEADPRAVWKEGMLVTYLNSERRG